MTSQATNDGSLSVTVTFKIGTNLDKAQVQVQNRVATAEPRLPAEVRALGVTVNKAASDFLMIVNLSSPDGALDRVRRLQLRAHQHPRRHHPRRRRRRHLPVRRARALAARLARSRPARRLRPDCRRRRGCAARSRTSRSRAARSARRRAPKQHDLRDHGDDARPLRGGRAVPRRHRQIDPGRTPGAPARTSRASSSGRAAISPTSISTASPRSASPSSSGRAPTRCRRRDAVKAKMEELKRVFRRASNTRSSTTRPSSSPTSINAVYDTFIEAIILVVIVIIVFLQSLAHGDHPDHRHPGLADRHLRRDGGARLLAQHADPVRPGPGHRHRRRRRHRRGRECRAQHPRRDVATRGGPRDDGRGRHRGHRHRAGARRGVHPDRLHSRTCPGVSTSSSP